MVRRRRSGGSPISMGSAAEIGPIDAVSGKGWERDVDRVGWPVNAERFPEAAFDAGSGPGR